MLELSVLGRKLLIRKCRKKEPELLVQTLCDPAGTRTQGPYIKSVLLYQLSYEINLYIERFS
jgi:hypothetical protein